MITMTGLKADMQRNDDGLLRSRGEWRDVPSDKTAHLWRKKLRAAKAFAKARGLTLEQYLSLPKNEREA